MANGRLPALLSMWLLSSLAIVFQTLCHSDRVLKSLVNVVDRTHMHPHPRRQSGGVAKNRVSPRRRHAAQKIASRPAFHSLVSRQEIVGNVQFLLDFAIVGFAKCSTSASIRWIASHPQAQVLPGETKSLKNHRPDELVYSLYYTLPSGELYKRGYKNPGDLKFFHAIEYLGRFFPQTKLMIALRHPVLRFESFYNFRSVKFRMPPPNQLIGKCTPVTRGVCTDSAALHHMLAQLGKTNMTSHEELDLFQQPQSSTGSKGRIPNKVFLYTDEQFGDKNKTRSRIFAQDVQHYLGFDERMPPIPSKSNGKSAHNDTRVQAKIDICNFEYDELRRVLMKHSRAASRWIRKYLLMSKDVTVSNQAYFKELVEKWMYDPCIERGRVPTASMNVHLTTK